MYQWGKKWVAPFFRWYHRMEVIHQERIPQEPGYVLVANHQTYLDPFLLGAILPHQPFFMAKQEAFEHWLLGPLLRGFEAFPVRREDSDIKAIKFGLKVLKEGKVLGIFPEGGRRQGNELEDLKEGASFFAGKANCPIVPMYISGSERAIPRGNGIPRPCKVRVFVGELICPEHYEHYKQMSEVLQERFLQLKQEAEKSR